MRKVLSLLLMLVTQGMWATVNVNYKLPGAFSVSSTKVVYFSKGNLQYQASTQTWRFAQHQYDYVGNAGHGNVYAGETRSNNANISSTYTGWIDLFGWATSGNSASGTAYQPWSTSTTNSHYGPSISSSEWTAANSDWGVVNAAQLGSGWRTLTHAEWVYLISSRTNASNLRTFATVDGILGLILMPDGWTAIGVSLAITTADYNSNLISLSDWNTLESQGCVFLPSAGYRGGNYNTTIDLVQNHGSYWSSTAYDAGHAYYLDVKTNGLDPSYHNDRRIGLSVRLVSESYFAGSGTAEDPYYIHSEADWNFLADQVAAGTNYSNQYFRQTGDFTVTRMVGAAINADGKNLNSEQFKTFNGTYDGDGHTLNLSLNITGERYVGPFHCVSGATIKNLIVTGSVTVSGGDRVEATRHPAALIGCSREGNVLIENCRVSANVSGADYLGGIIGHSWYANITMTGCVYSGTLTANGGNYTGGLIGWGGDGGGKTYVFSNNLFNGSYVNSNASGMFHPIGVLCSISNSRSLANTYYTVGPLVMTDAHGNAFVNGLPDKGTLATPTSNKPANIGTQTATYSVSGITAFTNGLCRNGQYYCGSPDFNFTLTTTLATVLGESKYVTTFYHGTLDFRLPADALAYTAGRADGKIVFYRIGTDSNIIPKHTAVIIVANTPTVALTKLDSASVSVKDGNILQGSDTNTTEASGTAYVLGAVNSTLGFYPITGNTIPAGKAYYVVAN